MLVALNKNEERIHSFEATKEEKYYCPICNGEMILKSGEVNITHFAHKNKECKDNWNYDMSEWHINKQSYFDERFQEVIVEKNGVKHRADVLKDGVVIEFQHSPISAEEFNERNKFYISAGHKVVWVFDLTLQKNEEQLYWDDYSDIVNMMRWKYPLRILKSTLSPSRKNGVLICITWDNEELGEEDVYRIDWSSTGIDEDDLGRTKEYPNYKKIIVSEPFIMERNMDLKQFFYSKDEIIRQELKKLRIGYGIKKKRSKRFYKKRLCLSYNRRIWY